MKARCERLGECGYEVPRVDIITSWLGPIYEIGWDEAARLAGGEEELAHAIVIGRVPVAAIPKDLLNEERLAERQEWLRQKRAESEALTNALFAELGLTNGVGE